MALTKVTGEGIGAITGDVSVDGGTIKLDGNYPVGTANVALGDTALDSLTSGSNNTAIGSSALTANTSASNNTAVGYQALKTNTTGTQNVALGYLALDANTTANANTAIGEQALTDNTTGANNTAVGKGALANNTTASENTALGRFALVSTSVSSANTAVGYYAGYYTTGTGNTYIGRLAGNSATSVDFSTFVGYGSGSAISTGTKNSILGRFDGNFGGLDIRTSSNNIVLSDGDGNPRVHIDSNGRLIVGNSIGTDTWPQATSTADEQKIQLQQTAQLDISTNQSGAIRVNINNGNGFPAYWYRNGTFVGSISVSSSATAYNTTSDYRLKENVVDMTGAIERVKQLSPKRFNFIADDTDRLVDGFLAHEAQTVVAEAVTGTHNEVDDDGNAVMQGIDQSKLVPLLTGALKEAIAKIEDLEARIVALENG